MTAHDDSANHTSDYKSYRLEFTRVKAGWHVEWCNLRSVEPTNEGYLVRCDLRSARRDAKAMVDVYWAQQALDNAKRRLEMLRIYDLARP